jgi:uncharacterized protein (TIGR02996 family)
MNQREAFEAAVSERPDDVATRLIFADWLEEHGEAEFGQALRLLATEPLAQDEAPEPFVHDEILQEGQWHRRRWHFEIARRACRAYRPRTGVSTWGFWWARVGPGPTPPDTFITRTLVIRRRDRLSAAKEAAMIADSVLLHLGARDRNSQEELRDARAAAELVALLHPAHTREAFRLAPVAAREQQINRLMTRVNRLLRGRGQRLRRCRRSDPPGCCRLFDDRTGALVGDRLDSAAVEALARELGVRVAAFDDGPEEKPKRRKG